MAGVKISGFGAAAPELCVSNDDIAKLVDTSDEWIRTRTGIEERRIATTEDLTGLCEAAAVQALNQAGIAAEELDLIIVATITPDLPLPNAASLLQARLNAVHATCFDISAACSGFLYALNTARLYIMGGAAKKALILGAEIISKITDWSDRSTCVLFGDGAGAAVLEADTVNHIPVVLTGADGSKGAALTYRERLIENPFKKAIYSKKDENSAMPGYYVSMAGPEIFKFALTKVPECISQVLEMSGLRADEIDHYVLHQANLRILTAVAKRLDVPEEKFFVNLERYGNTSAASIPVALAEMSQKHMFKPGDKVMIAGFGGGLTWGAGLIIF